MAELTIEIPEDVKQQAEQLKLDLSRLLSELIKREVLKRKMVERLKSKDEQDLIKWSVELGRKAKKGRFNRLLSEVSSETRRKLLEKISTKKTEPLEK